uniref:Uncharacterized protein n=1 Tax=Oryza barthii TaxID=65489 RepID=A0A0D3GG71_9ORYZ
MAVNWSGIVSLVIVSSLARFLSTRASSPDAEVRQPMSPATEHARSRRGTQRSAAPEGRDGSGDAVSLSRCLPRALLHPAMLAPARAPRPPRRAPSLSIVAVLGSGDEGQRRRDAVAALPTAVPPAAYPLYRPLPRLSRRLTKLLEGIVEAWTIAASVGTARLRRRTPGSRQRLDLLEELPSMHTDGVMDILGSFYVRWIEWWHTGAGGIKDGARRPELEKTMPIDKLAAPLARFLWGFRRGGRRDEDGVVAWP